MDAGAVLKPLHAFVDAGAVLREYDEEEVACSFLQFFLRVAESTELTRSVKKLYPARAAGYFTPAGGFAMKVATKIQSSEGPDVGSESSESAHNECYRAGESRRILVEKNYRISTVMLGGTDASSIKETIETYLPEEVEGLREQWKLSEAISDAGEAVATLVESKRSPQVSQAFI